MGTYVEPTVGYNWEVATKLLTHLPKGSQPARELYTVTAATCDVIDGHVAFYDADGALKHIRATGTFETVTRTEQCDD
tara:strand:- start:14834 stop:15067 length:234 start_codon:yes stop_codon:yes gene_type:complete